MIYAPKTLIGPSWESFKNNKPYKIWAKNVFPDFGSNVDINLLYLNNKLRSKS